nr:UDP-2,3-diacylglucosamine diphosphatase [Ramlibacter aurantiacus]
MAARPGWAAVDLISDLHLQAEQPATFSAFRHHLQSTPADAVLVLGDLFEAWVGDDAAIEPGFAADCAAVLRQASARRPVYFMPGNRDFLLGPDMAARCGMGLLSDPTVLVFGGRRWLLSHGDILCLADTAYQRFREQVHAPEWIAHFLRKPLVQREALARQMREASRVHQQALPAYADLDPEAVRRWLVAAGAGTMIHGHTHHPADHDLGDGLRRLVLSDWDLEPTAVAPRAQVMRLHADAAPERIDLTA